MTKKKIVDEIVDAKEPVVLICNKYRGPLVICDKKTTLPGETVVCKNFEEFKANKNNAKWLKAGIISVVEDK